ncbi:MAG: PQQ-like beta-propeller repeat protein [Planctomycetota bacterium]
MPRLVCCLALVALLGAVNVPILADDWPAFRGPRYDGVSLETDWKADFPEAGPRQAWKVEVGIGPSSVTVPGDRVLTMGNADDQDSVICLDANSGKELWRYTYDCKFEKRMYDGGTASTPTIDGDRVYAFSYDGQLKCLNLADGSLVWEKHVVNDFGGELAEWKYSCSPLIQGDLMILDIGGSKNSTVALNKADGSLVWGAGDEQAGYASPTPYVQNGKPAVLVFKGKFMVSHDLATGKQLWKLPWKTNYDVNASCPTAMGDKVFISSGYPGRSGRGGLYDVSSGRPKEIWVNPDLKTQVNSGVVHEGHVYGISQDKRGMLTCVSLETGETRWQERGSYGVYGSAVLAGGKLIVLSERGELSTVEASADGFKEISKAKVLEDKCWVAPVLANGRLYCRNNKGVLICFDMR